MIGRRLSRCCDKCGPYFSDNANSDLADYSDDFSTEDADWVQFGSPTFASNEVTLAHQDEIRRKFKMREDASETYTIEIDCQSTGSAESRLWFLLIDPEQTDDSTAGTPGVLNPVGVFIERVVRSPGGLGKPSGYYVNGVTPRIATTVDANSETVKIEISHNGTDWDREIFIDGVSKHTDTFDNLDQACGAGISFRNEQSGGDDFVVDNYDYTIT